MIFIKAFIIGGILCSIAQILIDKTKLTPARILVTYVVAGVVLSGIGLYKYLADFAECGASVPLLGFGHMLAEGVRKSVDEYGLYGAMIGGLTAASGGVCASILFAYLFSLIFNSKPDHTTRK